MKTYAQNSEANLGQTLRASLGLLILHLSVAVQFIVRLLQVRDRCYLTIKRMVV